MTINQTAEKFKSTNHDRPLLEQDIDAYQAKEKLLTVALSTFLLVNLRTERRASIVSNNDFSVLGMGTI